MIKLGFRGLSDIHKEAQLTDGLHGVQTHFHLTLEPELLRTITYLLVSGREQAFTI